MKLINRIDRLLMIGNKQCLYNCFKNYNCPIEKVRLDGCGTTLMWVCPCLHTLWPLLSLTLTRWRQKPGMACSSEVMKYVQYQWKIMAWITILLICFANGLENAYKKHFCQKLDAKCYKYNEMSTVLVEMEDRQNLQSNFSIHQNIASYVNAHIISLCHIFHSSVGPQSSPQPGRLLPQDRPTYTHLLWGILQPALPSP